MKNIEKWSKLKSTPGLGDISIKKLWDHFGSIDLIFNSDSAELTKVDGLSNRVIQSILSNRTNEQREACLPSEIEVITLEDKSYPENLSNICDPPPIIYCKGELLPQDKQSIAIVGTRKASYYGMSIAKKLASELANLGFTIVSGLASGIDTAAHEGAISAKGRTIAVLGTNISKIYPIENYGLSRQIMQNGAILSEVGLDEEAGSFSFPRRNRIISGLSLGTIVVEGSYKSGAMITAKLALDQGREVFAVPGNIESELTKGPHWLIKQGAKLTERVDDVLEELIHVMQAAPIQPNDGLSDKEIVVVPNMTAEENIIYKHLSHSPLQIDELVQRAGLDISKVLALLSQMEINQIVKQLPGKLFVKL